LETVVVWHDITPVDALREATQSELGETPAGAVRDNVAGDAKFV